MWARRGALIAAAMYPILSVDFGGVPSSVKDWVEESFQYTTKKVENNATFGTTATALDFASSDNNNKTNNETSSSFSFSSSSPSSPQEQEQEQEQQQQQQQQPPKGNLKGTTLEGQDDKTIEFSAQQSSAEIQPIESPEETITTTNSTTQQQRLKKKKKRVAAAKRKRVAKKNAKAALEVAAEREEKEDDAPKPPAEDLSEKDVEADQHEFEATADPDFFDRDLSLEDYAHLEPTWPSNKWLTSCAESLQNDTSIVKPFQLGSWGAYALGDCIKLCNKCGWGVPKNEFKIWTRYLDVTKLSRLSHMYMTQACPQSRANFTIVQELFDIVKDRPGFKIPDPQAVVIHLRLGDVIELQGAKAGTLLLKGGTGNHPSFKRKKIKSILSMRQYLQILDSVKDETNNKVVIVGGSHKAHLYKKSRVYANCLQRGLAKAGKNVEMYLDDGNPDQDFYFMSHAKHYIASTGGYSRYMGNLAQMGGGKIWTAEKSKKPTDWFSKA